MCWDYLNFLEGVGARKPSESSFLQERIRGKWSDISLNVLQTDTLLMYSFILQLNKTLINTRRSTIPCPCEINDEMIYYVNFQIGI